MIVIFDALLTLQYSLNLIPHDAATDAQYLATADVAPLDTVTRGTARSMSWMHW
jgi:hypothetical protein